MNAALHNSKCEFNSPLGQIKFGNLSRFHESSFSVQFKNESLFFVICRQQAVTVSFKRNTTKINAGFGFLALGQRDEVGHVRLVDGDAHADFAVIDIDVVAALRPINDAIYMSIYKDVARTMRDGMLTFSTPKAIVDLMISVERQVCGSASDLLRQIKAIELILYLHDALSDGQDATENASLGISKRDIASVRRACDFIDRNICSMPNMRDLSRLVGSNEKKLNNGFRKIHKMSVHEYLTDKRLNLARRLITQEQENFSVVAAEVGYTPSHLSYLIRKTFGVSPSEMRGSCNPISGKGVQAKFSNMGNNF